MRCACRRWPPFDLRIGAVSRPPLGCERQSRCSCFVLDNAIARCHHVGRRGSAAWPVAWLQIKHDQEYSMAQMPKGEPRSVPDPAGEQYDEMIRQERLKRARAEAAAAEPEPSAGSEYGLLFRPRLDFSRPARSPAVTVDGRQVDTGCVVGGEVPLSQSELAEQRRAIDRTLYIANNPLAGAAYGLAALAGASPQTRDRAMVGGGVADAAMMGAAPLGAAVRGRPAPPRLQTAPQPLLRDQIRPLETNSIGQAMGVNATLTPRMLGTGTRADPGLKPPGWQGDGRIFNEARGHLLAKALGGTGDEMWNLATLTHRGANTPQMSDFEGGIAGRVRRGEVIEYGAKPLYRDGILPPSAILLTATGSRGAPSARIISNPAGLRR